MPKPTPKEKLTSAQGRINVLELMVDTLMADHANSLTALRIIGETGWVQEPEFAGLRLICTSTVRHATALMAERRARLAEVV